MEVPEMDRAEIRSMFTELIKLREEQRSNNSRIMELKRKLFTSVGNIKFVMRLEGNLLSMGIMSVDDVVDIDVHSIDSLLEDEVGF
jgi:hypothetical protein